MLFIPDEFMNAIMYIHFKCEIYPKQCNFNRQGEIILVFFQVET